MSIFQPQVVVCPHCGDATERSIVLSLNAQRRPEVDRRAVLEDRFQRFRCGACRQPYVVDSPFIYLDLDANHWVGVFPLGWEARWRAVENEPLATYLRAATDQAPPMVRDAWGQDATVRAVFGLQALRDKLVCFDAGLDDGWLECAKLDLMRTVETLTFNPGTRLYLWQVTPDHLVFTVDEGRFTVERALLDRIAADRVGWAPVRARLREGPFVDVLRLLS